MRSDYERRKEGRNFNGRGYEQFRVFESPELLDCCAFFFFFNKEEPVLN